MAGIFISYRRSDSAGHTGRLVDDLAEQLDGQALFHDLEALEAGVDFVDALEKAVSSCSVMLVMIGPTWASAATADGQRRLHQPGDFVRMEVEAALARNIRVIPVLVGDAEMPTAADLPASMAPLLRRHAYAISDRRWQYDVTQLLNILVKIPGVAPLRAQPPPAPPPPPAKAPTTGSTAKPAVPAWAFGAFAVLVVLAIVMVGALRRDDVGTDAKSATSSSAKSPDDPAATPGAQAIDPDVLQSFLGRWLAEDGSLYLIDTSDQGIYVAAGSNLEADVGFSEESPPPDRPGMELFGDAAIDGRTLHVDLVDGYSGEVTRIELTPSADGETLEGSLEQATRAAHALVLTRE